MTTGTVKTFDPDRGFGFIAPDGGGADIFVHATALKSAGLASLETDQRVAFDAVPGRPGKGPIATNLRLLATAGGRGS